MEARIKNLSVGDSYPVRIMGVINVSPESFYKGSVRTTPEEVSEEATRMSEQGVDIIDVGAMSSAPYLETWIPEDEEANRARAAIKAVREVFSGPLSIDTFRPKPAAVALEEGADMINDVSGLGYSAELAKLAVDHDAALLLMANNVEGEVDIIRGIEERLKRAIELAVSSGVREENIVIDPGIGFHRKHVKKWYLVDAEIIRRLRELRVLGRPICIGISRKSFLGKVTGKGSPEERLIGSVAAEAVAVMNGAHIVRTHNVAESRDAVRVASLIAARRL